MDNHEGNHVHSHGDIIPSQPVFAQALEPWDGMPIGGEVNIGPHNAIHHYIVGEVLCPSATGIIGEREVTTLLHGQHVVTTIRLIRCKACDALIFGNALGA